MKQAAGVARRSLLGPAALLPAFLFSACAAGAVRQTVPEDDGKLAWAKSAELPRFRNFPVAAFISDGEVLIAGGYRNIDDDLKESFVLDVGKTTLSPAPPLIHARHFQFSCIVNGDLVVLGGSGTLNTMEVFDHSERQWRHSGPVPVEGLGFVVCPAPGAGMLLLGGSDGKGHGIKDTHLLSERYSWKTCTPMPTARFDSAAVALKDGRILVSGGYTEDREILRHVARDTHITRNCEIYDVAQDKWRSVEQLHLRRARHHAVVLAGGDVLVVGGYTSGQEWTDQCELYDPKSDKWTLVERLPQLRDLYKVCALPDGDALLIGGREFTEKAEPVDNPVEDVRVTFRFRTASRTWARGPRLHEPRTSFAAAASAQGILILGGYSSGPSTSSEFLRFN
jgi:hypothetical protein